MKKILRQFFDNGSIGSKNKFQPPANKVSAQAPRLSFRLTARKGFLFIPLSKIGTKNSVLQFLCP